MILDFSIDIVYILMWIGNGIVYKVIYGQNLNHSLHREIHSVENTSQMCLAV